MTMTPKLPASSPTTANSASSKAPGKTRNARLLRTYGITCEDYDKLMQKQNGVCFVCQRPAKKLPLNVDHDHKLERALKKQGKGPRESVRGLLCYRHNKGMGWFNDNPEYLSRASTYLYTPPARDVLGNTSIETAPSTSLTTPDVSAESRPTITAITKGAVRHVRNARRSKAKRLNADTA